MIKTFYCHQGDCPFQCKVTISSNGEVSRPQQCLFVNISGNDPIWKEKSYTEGLERMSVEQNETPVVMGDLIDRKSPKSKKIPKEIANDRPSCFGTYLSHRMFCRVFCEYGEECSHKSETIEEGGG